MASSKGKKHDDDQEQRGQRGQREKPPSPPSAIPAPSPAPKGERYERAAQVRSKRSQLEDAKRRARDDVCVGPKYPGSPHDYTYVLQEYCRPRRSTCNTHTPSQGRGKSGSAEIVRSADREIRVIERALNAYGPNNKGYLDHFPANAAAYIDDVFGKMIAPRRRAAVPDPLARYDDVVREVLRDEDSVHAEEMPRYMLLTMVKYHLLAVKKLYLDTVTPI